MKKKTNLHWNLEQLLSKFPEEKKNTRVPENLCTKNSTISIKSLVAFHFQKLCFKLQRQKSSSEVIPNGPIRRSAGNKVPTRPDLLRSLTK